MPEELHQLDDWLAGLLRQISPDKVRLINRRVAADLRRAQSRRIASQQNPDGSPYAGRSSKNLRLKKGKIKRKAMFARLRTARYLKSISNDRELSVGFMGRAAVIASVHQFGLQQTQGGKTYSMPKRELLGLTDADIEFLADAYLRHMAAVD